MVDSLDRVLYGYSPDATLSALALADGAGNAIDLNPAFAPDETAYEAAVVGDRITVLATADGAASVEYVDANGAKIADQDPVAQGHQMNLVAGANVVRVRVGSADGFASKTYAVSVTSTRPELVTNLGETLDDAALSSVVAQRFTTGSSPYRLHSVTIQLDALGLNASSGDSHLTVWSESGGEPDTRIVGLSSPTLQEFGPNTFVVRGDRVFLNPGTDYFLVVNHRLAEDARIALRLTQTTLEMSDFAWRIADTVLHSAEASPTSWDEAAGVLSMRVSGDELRECAVDLEGRTEVWSSTLTVGPIRHLPAYIDSYGFRRDRNAGALSEDDFDFRSAAGVEIDRLSVRTVDGTLVFDESPDLPDADRRALRLHVCVDVFNLADATLETQLGLTTWGDAGLDWSALRTVSVALSEMSSAATLSGLEVADAAGNAIELDDDFAPDMFAYTAMVANAIVRITVTPTADPADATIGYKDGANALLTDADPDADGFQVDLIPGDNVVRVEVTGSGDGATTLTYTVTVARGTTVDLGTIPADWSLKPDAVGAGETFRLMFVSTTTRNGSSTDIADYNTHVQTAAATGRAEIRPYSADFTAIGSTAAVNARDNTQTGSTHTDAPIYWVHAQRSRGAVADNYADFYDGTWGNTGVRTQSGTSADSLIASRPAITGTDLNGGTNGRLGSSSISVWYLSSGTLVKGSTSPGNLRRLLALSPIFRVAGGASAATLSDLEVADGAGNAIELDDDFAPDIFAYTATVANAIVRITVTPTADDADATYEIQDVSGTELTDADLDADGFQVDLVPGDNVVQVEVTGADGATTLVYTLTVTRAGPELVSATVPATGDLIELIFDQDVSLLPFAFPSGGMFEVTVDGAITQIGGTLQTADSTPETPSGKDGWVINVDTGFAFEPGATVVVVYTDPTAGDDERAVQNTSGVDAASFTTGMDDVPAVVNDSTNHQPTSSDSTATAIRDTDYTFAASDFPFIDADAGDTLRDVRITTLPGAGEGTLKKNGTAITPRNILRDEIDAGELTYSPPAGETGTGVATFEFRVRDASVYSAAAYTMTIDVVAAETVAPRVASIERRNPSSSPTNADSLTWRVTFNENVGNVDAADFAVAATTASLAVVQATASTVYDVTASGGDLAGLTATVTLSFASGQDIADTAGNALSNTAPTGANQAGYAVDNTRPTVTIAVPGTSSAPFDATFAFSEAVSGFGVGDIGVGNGTASDFMGADGDTAYSAEIAPAANGAVTVDVAADVATDAAGNGNTAAAQAASDYTDANGDPTFDRASTSREVDENTPSGQLFGDAVSADDPDGDTLKYTLEGADAASFRIGRTTGRLRTSAALDHEAKPSHTLTVKADDERGGTATIVVTVNVTDVDEPPAAPGAPTVSAVEGSATSLSVRWSAPANTGPRVTDYDLRHKKTGGGWTDGPENVTGRSATIGGLARDTEYEVQVLARNDEGESGWSPSGRRTTGQAARSVHMEDVTVHEGETARFTIVFSPARSDDRLLWETHDNRARAGEDFPRTSRGTALQAGATEVTGEVEIYADDEAEDEERFQIAITFGDVGDTVEYAGSIYIRDGAGSNTAPEFADGTSTTREVAENTASGQPVGGVVDADDADEDPLTYTLEGADAASFGIDRTTGRLRTRAALDHEAKASYTLRVKADDDHGGTARIVVTVNVEDVAEKPATAAAPRVSATADATDSLDVAWRKPGLDGGPDIVGYKLQYEVSGSGSWTETTPSGTGTTATIGTLAEDTEYAVQVRALNGETPSDWSPSGTGRTGAESNTAPEFADGTSTTREVAENTASGQPVGRVVEADDADEDPLTYTLEGADAASFGIDRTTGQLRTAAALDHEAKAAYEVTVRADDDHGGTATIAVTVNVDDVREKPATPAAPGVSATPNATDSLDVSWTEPDLAGGPDIVGYRLRRGVRGGSGWFETTTRYPATARSATIDGLAEDTEYDVRVRALNGEDTSDWSPPGFGRTGANAAPVFDDGARTTRSVAENTASGRPVGRPVSADDANDDELTYTLEGPDAGSFGIDRRTGQLRTSADLDHESKASHALTVKADDGEGGTATIDVTVNATDVDEPPRAPDAPSVEGSATSLSVRWSAPENTGPPVTYDLRYRETGGGSWTDGPENVAGRSASIGGLAADTEYEVQVLARNDEGGSGWSASGGGRTDGGGRSVYMEDVAVYEGETARFTIVFSPARSDDRLLWETHDNRARAGEDFPRTGRGIALQAGATEVTGEVEIYADDEAEGEERFQIAITFGDVGDTVEYAGSIYINDGARPASANPSARVVGDLLTLRYADPLDAGSTPGPKDWVVRAATATGSRTLAVTGVSVSGAEVALVLSPPAAAGESVAVSYLPWAMHPLLGPEGAEAVPLMELPVRNETPATAPVEPPPVLLDIEAVLLAGEPTAGTPAPFGPWLSALLAERPAASLVRLDLPDRGLTDISALAELTGLEVLDLHGNELADVWPLAGLANLRRLDLSANRIEDVSALAGLAELEVLLLDGNRVADVLPLALLARLARLDLSGNRVADAALLAELRSLARLDLSGNRVADASPLGDLSRLVWLDLTGNPVSDAAPLGRLTALRWLWLDAGAPGLGALAPLAERPAPVRIEVGAPAETAPPH